MSSTGYRQGQRRCPICAVPLDEQLHGAVHIDVCPECSGIWLDWLDGDVKTVAADLSIPHGQPRPGSRGDTPHPGSRGDTPHPGPRGDTPHPGPRGDTPHPGPGTLACPVCSTDLDTSPLEGISLLRCGTCAGAFVKRATLDDLKRSLGNEHTPAVRDPFLTRVLDAITRFVLPG